MQDVHSTNSDMMDSRFFLWKMVMIFDGLLGCPWNLVTIVSKLGYFTYLRDDLQPTFIGDIIH